MFDFYLWAKAGRFALIYLRELHTNTDEKYSHEIWELHTKYAILFLQTDSQPGYKFFRKFIRSLSENKKERINLMNTFDNFLRLPPPPKIRSSFIFVRIDKNATA